MRTAMEREILQARSISSITVGSGMIRVARTVMRPKDRMRLLCARIGESRAGFKVVFDVSAIN
jgi:hypothetical protein